MSTPHICRPLRFLKARLGRNLKVFYEPFTTFKKARLLADRGDGLAVQNLARAAHAKDAQA